MNHNLLSIGILSYKRTDLLLQTLRDIVRTTCLIDLIILNNNEDVDIINEILDVVSPSININLNYLWYKKNLGVSSGRRIIVENCSTEFIMLLDDDVEIESIDSIIKSIINNFKENDKIGGIAFNILDSKTGFPNHYEIPHKNKHMDMSKKQNTYLMIGAGHAFRTQLAVSVGNYANDFGLYGCEEIDLAFRIINNGYTILYEPDCEILHKRSPDGRFSGIQVNYQALVNRSKIAKRHFKTRYFISCIFIRSIYFLYKTKSINIYIKALKDIFGDKKKEKFGSYFYNYIKSVNGFIYY